MVKQTQHTFTILNKNNIKTYKVMNNEQDMAMAAMPQPQVERMPEPVMDAPQEYKPSNKEALRNFEIRIRFLDRGCIVSVGCKEIAFENYIEAMAAINKYVANPWEEQQVWRKILD
jgi:hypothetical protein